MAPTEWKPTLTKAWHGHSMGVLCFLQATSMGGSIWDSVTGEHSCLKEAFIISLA